MRKVYKGADMPIKKRKEAEKMPKVENTKENENICMRFCGTCPTYPGLEGEALFCARGKSKKPPEKKGCNCPQCDVQKKYGCKGTYYCIKGVCE